MPWKMAQALKEEKVGKGEFVAYAIIFAAFCLLLVVPFTGAYDYLYIPAWLKWAEFGVEVLLLIGITALAYYLNKKGDGKRFWYRYLSISFPIAVILIPVGIAVLTLSLLIGFTQLEFYGYTDLVLLILLAMPSLYLTVKYMRQIASENN